MTSLLPPGRRFRYNPPMPLRFSRRHFLASSAAAFGFPTIVPSSVFGKSGRPAPSERITVGCIGWGTIAGDWTPSFLNNEKCQVIAVADPMKEYGHYGYDGKETGGREAGRKIIDQHYSQAANKNVKTCTAYEDFREMMEQEDLDAVQVSTPDHWHAYMAVYAARKGKHVYGQKPLALNIGEGRLMADEVAKAGVTWQTGSQQRSDIYFRMACEMVRNNRIGKLKRVRVGLPGGHSNWNGMADKTEVAPVPADFNYELWLGPAEQMDYRPALLPLNWRHNFNFSGGMITDFGAHHIDIAQWGMGTEHTGPVELRAVSGTLNNDALYNTATAFAFECVYDNGVIMQVASPDHKLMPEVEAAMNIPAGKKAFDHVGVLFEGDAGKWIYVNRGKITASDPAILREKIGAEEIHLYESKDHTDNFLSCIYDGKPTATPVEIGHRSITVAHLANIALRTGSTGLKWNPQTEKIEGNEAASKLLSKEWRKPWVL
ncbi:MAG: Gfo/Idh/MocA family oxidoreductase [Verrucomicrobiota bacterium]